MSSVAAGELEGGGGGQDVLGEGVGQSLDSAKEK